MRAAGEPAGKVRRWAGWRDASAVDGRRRCWAGSCLATHPQVLRPSSSPVRCAWPAFCGTARTRAPLCRPTRLHGVSCGGFVERALPPWLLPGNPAGRASSTSHWSPAQSDRQLVLHQRARAGGRGGPAPRGAARGGGHRSVGRCLTCCQGARQRCCCAAAVGQHAPRPSPPAEEPGSYLGRGPLTPTEVLGGMRTMPQVRGGAVERLAGCRWPSVECCSCLRVGGTTSLNTFHTIHPRNRWRSRTRCPSRWQT